MEMPEQETVEAEQQTEEVVIEDMEENEEKRFEDKVVRKVGNQFCVIAEVSGRNMGCYPTRELANARLEQISRFSENPRQNPRQHRVPSSANRCYWRVLWCVDRPRALNYSAYGEGI